MHVKYLILLGIINLLYLSSKKKIIPTSLPNLMQNIKHVPAQRFLNNYESFFVSVDGEETSQSSGEETPMDLEYSGNWYEYTQETNASLFDRFVHTSGYGAFTGKYETSSSVTEDAILIELYDGQYIDKNFAIIFIPYNSSALNQSTSTYSNSSAFIQYYLGYSDSLESQSHNCTGAYELNFLDTSKTPPAPFEGSINSDNYENILATLSVNSTNCSIAIHTSISVTDSANETRAMIYAIFSTLICIIHVVACLALIKAISLHEFEGNQFSLITLGTFTCWDVFLCLFNLYQALSENNYFHYFITPAFWYFILSAIFETRVMLLCWRTRYYSHFQSTSEFRRAISKFYFHLYGSLLLFLFLGYFFLPETWFMYLTCPFLVPQIVHNAIRGQKVKFNSYFLFLLGYLRIGIPIYVKSYSESVFRYTPVPSFAIWYSSIIFLQIVLLFVQSKFGPRSIVPNFLLPPKYNYFIKINLDDSELLEENCSICLSSYLEEAGTVVSSKDPLLDPKSKKRTIKIMKTPCNHMFHEKCLKDWMDFKLECPFCRARLPPL